MNKYTSIIIISMITLLGCNQKSSDSYTQYLSQIPKLDLPYNLNCKNDLDRPVSDLSEAILAKHKPEGAVIYGRFESNRDYSVLIYLYAGDIMWPVITTASMNNNKISEASPLNGLCWELKEGDPFGFCNCEIIIDNDFNIEVVKKFDDKAVVARYSIDENGIINEEY